MEERRPAEVFAPGEFIREELAERGWTQVEFAGILGRPLTLVNEIISGKRGITPETAMGIGEAFGTSAQFWLNLEATYRLSRIRGQDGGVARRARLYTKAPIREMVKRHWIETSDNVDVLEKRLLDFFAIKSLDEEPVLLPHAARKSASPEGITPAQNAWLFRARKLAQAVPVSGAFSPERFQQTIASLRDLLRDVGKIGHVQRVLADAGIRFLIVEPLPQTHIDGACFWLAAESPVVVLSLRFDRIDAFWHTLMHELGHVQNKDGTNVAALDTYLVGEGSQPQGDKSQSEQEADRFAAEALIPQEALQSFTTSVRPLYSKQKICAFAAQMQVHPGIVVGQLQHRGEIPYSHSREMLVKVRSIVTQSALADGWGCAPVAAP